MSTGVTAPLGFRAAAVASGIKPDRLDLALVVADAGCTAAGVFTTNLAKAAPVVVSRDHLASGRARAIVVNAGCANAGTGEAGLADARETAEIVAHTVGCRPEEVLVASTGVIGVRLPMERVRSGIAQAARRISRHAGADAARAIMTTDTKPKEVAVEFRVGDATCLVGGMAKGAGMIAPNMATMFCIITTDAAVESRSLAGLLRRAAGVSFNQMCIDNDMSTSDSVICLANGASGVPMLEPGTDDFAEFGVALINVCQEIAKALVRDGEGATKFVEIVVTGTADDQEAKRIARAIATSQLCKTAFFGQDPNWGRIACAAGYAGVAFDPESASIWIDDVQVMSGGMPARYEEAAAAACMRKPEFCIRVNVGDGPGTSVFWTSDLSHKYVEINADYRT